MENLIIDTATLRKIITMAVMAFLLSLLLSDTLVGSSITKGYHDSELVNLEKINTGLNTTLLRLMLPI